MTRRRLADICMPSAHARRRLAGADPCRVIWFAYSLCGLLAGVGGVLMMSRYKSASPSYGLTYELYVIAAVVVGGTSLSGGEGRIFNTLVGASSSASFRTA